MNDYRDRALEREHMMKFLVAGEIWCDFSPQAKASGYTWFKITAVDHERDVVLGYRWPTPQPEGAAARKWIEENPRLGVADVSSVTYFRNWCER